MSEIVRYKDEEVELDRILNSKKSGQLSVLKTMNHESFMMKILFFISKVPLKIPWKKLNKFFILTSALLPPTPLVRSIMVVVTFPSFIKVLH